jgi:hypothetical protein
LREAAVFFGLFTLPPREPRATAAGFLGFDMEFHFFKLTNL